MRIRTGPMWQELADFGGTVLHIGVMLWMGWYIIHDRPMEALAVAAGIYVLEAWNARVSKNWKTIDPTTSVEPK